MPDPTPIDFVPKWLRGRSSDDFDDGIVSGSIPEQSPRIVTRLVPRDHSSSLPARIVSRVIVLKQSLALHAARDVVEGYNPAFADLTSLKKPLQDFAALTIEAFETGSFVIPARLDSAPLRGRSTTERFHDTEAIARRFISLLFAIENEERATSISIGALQCCRELGKLVNREIETIELAAYDRENAPLPHYTLTAASMRRIDELLDHRQSTHSDFEILTGRLEALDLGKNEFQLKVPGRRGRVKGTAVFFPVVALRDYLGEDVSLEGNVVRQGKRLTLTAFRVAENREMADQEGANTR